MKESVDLDAWERTATTPYLEEPDEPLADDDGICFPRREILQAIAELRASRKVVEAAEAYVTAKEREAELTEPWNAPEIDGGIVRALSELALLNVRSEEGK